MPMKTSAALGLLAVAVAGFAMTPAHAGAPFSEYSCHELWSERNGVFANKGYCFTSPKSIAAFGKGCFAPYGELNTSEKKIVGEIKKWEAIKGCN